MAAQPDAPAAAAAPHVAPAPIFADIAAAAPMAQAWWLRASDGVRLRAARLGAGDKGTVLLLPGRTEYVEKYGPAGQAFAARGWGTVAIDWRGQGLADRPLPDRATGHVDSFPDYQRDVAALLDALPDMGVDLGRPLMALGHSMGGAIGLRAVLEGLPVLACAFTGPMWGIALSPVLRPVARIIVSATRPIGLGARYAPGTNGGCYLIETPFSDNLLTSDAKTYAWMRDQVTAHPELRLGGPSNAWVHEALSEIRYLHRQPLPDLPCLTVMGAEEAIIDSRAVADLVARWPRATLHTVPIARHEVMMEAPSIRDAFFDRAAAFYDAACP